MTNLGVYAYWPASFPHDMPSGSDKGTKKTSGHHPACISCHVLVASPSNKPDKGTPRRESRWPRRASLLPTAAAVMTTTTIVSDISDTSAGSGPLGPLIIIATIEHGDTYETEAHLSWRRWDEVPERVERDICSRICRSVYPGRP